MNNPSTALPHTLQEGDELYHALFDQAAIGICFNDLTGRFTRVNRRFCDITGYEASELLSMTYRDITHPEDLHIALDDHRQLFEGEIQSYSFEKRYFRKNGAMIWINLTLSLLRDSAGTPIYEVGMIEDITQRKQTEIALHIRQNALETSINGIAIADAAGRLTYVNPAFRQLWGYASDQEVLGRSALEFWQSPEQAAQVMAALHSQNGWIGELTAQRKDGALLELQVSASLVNDEQGKPTSLMASFVDISNRKRAEATLHEQTRRLQALSSQLIEIQETERRNLSRELHDELGQILTAIKINLQAVQSLQTTYSTPALDRPIADSIAIVNQALQQVRDLSSSLRPALLDDLGLIAALRWYLDRQQQRTHIRMQLSLDVQDTRFHPDLEVVCFRIVQEAVTNVVRHARAKHVRVALEQYGAAIQLIVSDDGVGFDVDVAFGNAARGISVGLLGMQERTLLLNGQFVIKSSPGSGTTIRVYFPYQLRVQPAKSIA